MLVICLSLFTRAQGNKAYPLQMDSGEVFVYCYMSGHDLRECEDGRWTLVMKIDGKKVYLVANCLKSSIERHL